MSRVPELPELSPKRKQRDSRRNQLFINNFNFKKQSALVPFGGSRGFRPVGSAPSEGSRAGFPFILHVRAQPVGQRHHPRPPGGMLTEATVLWPRPVNKNPVCAGGVTQPAGVAPGGTC